jgi:hypothetical protein
MDKSLDIFRLESDGTALWRGTAEGFDAAKARVKALASLSPGDYMIYSPVPQEPKLSLRSTMLQNSEAAQLGAVHKCRYSPDCGLGRAR